MDCTLNFIYYLAGILTSIATIIIAIVAYTQMRFIKEEDLPIFILKKLSPTTYVLFNVGKSNAYNISVVFNNTSIPLLFPMEPGSFIEIKVSSKYIFENSIINDKKEDKISIQFDSKYLSKKVVFWRTGNIEVINQIDANFYKNRLLSKIRFD